MLAPHAAADFPAKLYTPEGELLAEGKGAVTQAEHAVNFTADFVPLYPIGTPLVIERIFQNRAVHRFFGQVFLASRTRMRLTSAEDLLLPGAEELYCGKMAYPATLTAIDTPAPPRFPAFLSKNRSKAAVYPALIVEMTDRLLECQLEADDSDAFVEDTPYLLNPLGSLPLPPATVCVEKCYAFGSLSSCIFRFDCLEPETRQMLKAFLITHMRQQYKLF